MPNFRQTRFQKSNNRNFFQPESDKGNYTKNMFTKPLGNKYAKKFLEVYEAPLATRDEKMKALYEESKNDESLNDQQKRIISGCYLGYKDAIAQENVSNVLIAFIHKEKPNLIKALSEKRIKRTVDDIYFFMERSGFNFEVYLLLDFLEHFVKLFSTMKKQPPKEDKYPFEFYLVAAISKFARTISPIAYANAWYLIMLMKNISLLSYVNVNNVGEHTIEEVKNLLKLINIIHHLELQRAGFLEKIESKEDVNNEIQEKSVLIHEEDNIDEHKQTMIEEEKDEPIIIDTNIENQEKSYDPENKLEPVVESMEQLENEIKKEPIEEKKEQIILTDSFELMDHFEIKEN